MSFYYNLPTNLQILILIFISLLIGYLIRLVFFRIISSGAENSENTLKRILFQRFKGAWFLFIPIILFLIFFPREEIDESALFWIIKVSHILIIFSFVTIAIRGVNVVQDVLFEKYDISKVDNAKERSVRTQLSFVKKIFVIVIIIIAISTILLNFEEVRKYGAAILTSAGIVGIILGFAAQKTLANLLAGIQIAFTQPIKIDDVVIVENEWGWIEEINLTYVVVKIWDLRRLVLPITYFVEKPFQNWTRTTADLLGSVFLYVDYQIPLKELRQKFDEILEQSTLWDKKNKVLQVTDSTEKSMQIRLLMSARNSPQAWDLRCEVREKMIEFIQKKYPESLPKTRAEISGYKSMSQ